MAKQAKMVSRTEPGSIFNEKLLATLVTPGDCFGTFDATVSECHGCHDQYACAMFQQFNLKTKVAAVEKEKGPFLDQTTFPTEQEMTEILTVGKTYDQLLDEMKQKSVCPDVRTIEIFLDSAIRSRDLRFKGGVLC